MITMKLEREEVLRKEPEMPHVGPAPAADPLVHSAYFLVVFHDVLPKAPRGTVKAYDPQRWPYGPEEDCRKDWEATEE